MPWQPFQLFPPVAAALFHIEDILQIWPHLTKIGVILCGGNTVLTNFP